MKKIFIITFVLLTSIGFGQTAIKKDNISTGGGSSTVGNTTIIYSVGEIALQENTVGNIHISEGFISPDLLQPFDVEEYSELQGVRIFPNPVVDVLNINFESESDYQFIITDISGKQIAELRADNGLQQKINMENYERAVYILIIKDLKNKRYCTFKMIKK